MLYQLSYYRIENKMMKQIRVSAMTGNSLMFLIGQKNISGFCR